MADRKKERKEDRVRKEGADRKTGEERKNRECKGREGVRE